MTEEKKFTKQEIVSLAKATANPFASIKWKKAFDYYNEHHERKLGMGCRPCYSMVLAFLIETQL